MATQYYYPVARKWIRFNVYSEKSKIYDCRVYSKKSGRVKFVVNAY